MRTNWKKEIEKLLKRYGAYIYSHGGEGGKTIYWKYAGNDGPGVNGSFSGRSYKDCYNNLTNYIAQYNTLDGLH